MRLVFSVLVLFILAACGGDQSNSSSSEHNQPDGSVVKDTRDTVSQGNYRVLSTPMLIPGLARKRTIRLYLPPGYNDSHSGYPVLYMHDAQNLFDDATAYAGEWHVDETLNKLAQEYNLQIIVVGIDNGEDKRINELSAWDHPEYGKSEGKQYTDFIVHTLKPFIDQNYNTNSADSAIMGSSLGGLSAHYGIFQYPNIFSRAGIFSPSYWYSEEVFTFTQQQPISDSHRLYFTVGQHEGKDMTKPMQRMVNLIKESGHSNLYSDIDPNGEHNEVFWARRFEDAILWLYEVN